MSIARRNIELKARLASIESARNLARRVATSTLGSVLQVDTYFRCTHGRLKLRETGEAAAQLVWYQREDQAQARASDYQLVSVDAGGGLKDALAGALGVLVVVEKQREIHLHENVRIHLDQVRGLGSFLELEAVIGSPDQEQAAPELLSRLMRHFGLAASDILAGSYSDMLLAARYE